MRRCSAGAAVLSVVVLACLWWGDALAVRRRDGVLGDVLCVLEQFVEGDRPRVLWEGGRGRLEELAAQAGEGRNRGPQLLFESFGFGVQGLDAVTVCLVLRDWRRLAQRYGGWAN